MTYFFYCSKSATFLISLKTQRVSINYMLLWVLRILAVNVTVKSPYTIWKPYRAQCSEYKNWIRPFIILWVCSENCTVSPSAGEGGIHLYANYWSPKETTAAPLLVHSNSDYVWQEGDNEKRWWIKKKEENQWNIFQMHIPHWKSRAHIVNDNVYNHFFFISFEKSNAS